MAILISSTGTYIEQKLKRTRPDSVEAFFYESYATLVSNETFRTTN